LCEVLTLNVLCITAGPLLCWRRRFSVLHCIVLVGQKDWDET
jgi:hypothetical protein